MAINGFNFQFDETGRLLNNAVNLEALRKLWLDRVLINGEALGPGNDGDFDNGAWHVACHLLGGGGVLKAKDGRILWLEISHDPKIDRYFASVTFTQGADVKTIPLNSGDGTALTADASLLGYVEGNSVGHISARNVNDPPTLFNLWVRQDFDQPIDSAEDGGKVWEHWCTLRDIRAASAIGTSVLVAYLSLVSRLGDLFVTCVARGRQDYGHPDQLRAMVKAGFVTKASAVRDMLPTVIPGDAERLFLEAEPAKALKAAQGMTWSAPPVYYMFKRRIARWQRTEDVKRLLES